MLYPALYCPQEVAVPIQSCTEDSIHLLEINKGRFQAITTLPVAVFEFSILFSQVLYLGRTRNPICQTTSVCFVDRALLTTFSLRRMV